MTEPIANVLELGRQHLNVATWGDGAAEIVLLHDGLGSIRQWRGVPEAVHRRTGRTVLAYDRAGHGSSTPSPTGPWPTRWLHAEAEVFAALLDEVAVDEPLLVGHSDGGSIALLTAAAGRPVRGLVTIAAHSFVEQVCVDEITKMRDDTQRWVAGLARAHERPGELFAAWSGVWTSRDFRAWDVRPALGSVACPTIVVQGLLDEYGTPEQAIETAAAIGEHATCMLLPGRGHLVHHEAPDRVVAIIAEADRSTCG